MLPIKTIYRQTILSYTTSTTTSQVVPQLPRNGGHYTTVDLRRKGNNLIS